MLRKFYYLFLTVALLGGAACSSSDSDDSDPTPPEGETVLVGQISDATTGKGIAGVSRDGRLYVYYYGCRR